MKARITLILILLINWSFFAQVKIGDDPTSIHASSILELESSDKVLVITRMDTNQMNAIQPLKGALVYNITENCVFTYDGVLWINLCETGTDPGLDTTIKVTTQNNAPTDNNTGDFWINTALNNTASIWDGTTWISLKTTISANNGLNLNEINNLQTVQLGGVLIKATIIETSPTNTFAITGLQNGNLTNNNIIAVDKTTGVLRTVTISNLFKEEVIKVTADDGQVVFDGLTLRSTDKINVYRNGIRIDFTIIDNTKIEIEAEAICYSGDEIRIVQFY